MLLDGPIIADNLVLLNGPIHADNLVLLDERHSHSVRSVDKCDASGDVRRDQINLRDQIRKISQRDQIEKPDNLSQEVVEADQTQIVLVIINDLILVQIQIERNDTGHKDTSIWGTPQWGAPPLAC